MAHCVGRICQFWLTLPFACLDGERIGSFSHSAPARTSDTEQTFGAPARRPPAMGARAARAQWSVATVADDSDPPYCLYKKGMTANPRNGWSAESVSDSKESISVYFCSELGLQIEQNKSHS